MHAKYADVVTTEEALAFFESLPADMFDLPKGAPEGPVSLGPAARLR
jgi:hypothetical protein